MTRVQQSDRAFGLTFAAVFLIVFLVGWWGFGARLYWATWIAAVFAALALFAPGVLLPLNRLWGWFAFRLGHANNYLVLGIFLYLVITPLGLVMRLFGCDPLARRLERRGSYWTPVTRRTDAETLNDMF